MTTQEFLPIEKEYRPSLVICLGLMTLLVIFMGISLSCLVRYQNIQIAELQEVNENQWYMINAYYGFWQNSERIFDDRISKLEEKRRIEIVNIEDGRIDDLWFEVYGGQYDTVIVEDFQSRIDRQDIIIDNFITKYYDLEWLLAKLEREESPCRRDKIITP